jgi:hypothetical protein
MPASPDDLGQVAGKTEYVGQPAGGGPGPELLPEEGHAVEVSPEGTWQSDSIHIPPVVSHRPVFTQPLISS